MSPKFFQVAIDGPVASGKGTVARLVANRLGMLYVDTGAMYRAVALLAQRHQLLLTDETAILELLSHHRIQLLQPTSDKQDGRLITVLLDDEDISWAIRTEVVSSGSSQVAILPKLREELVRQQQLIAEKQNVVMEGRDITYRVLPNAQLKIFLTASIEKRAERRFLDLQKRGQNISLEAVYNELKERDQRDSQRLADPLQVVKDAWVLDTSDLTIEQAVEHIAKRAEELRKK